METDKGIIGTGAPGKLWQGTVALRWFTRTFKYYDGFDPAEREGQEVVLQQAWECRETGEIEWRDIPGDK